MLLRIAEIVAKDIYCGAYSATFDSSGCSST
jgi:hypothetical protein